MSQERTRFPITPQERHETAKSSKDVEAKPEENQPQKKKRPQDKPLPPDAAGAGDEDKPGAGDDEPQPGSD
jgi:hypothetical protein